MSSYSCIVVIIMLYCSDYNDVIQDVVDGDTLVFVSPL